ncbi:MAG: DUF4097 domain-containing protein [Rhodothermales bacterium]
MKQNNTVLRFLFVALVFVFAASTVQAKSAQVRDVIKKSYDVRPGGTINLDIDFGNIEVETTSESRVLIELERIAKSDDRARAEQLLKDHEYSFDKTGNTVIVRSRFDRRGGILRRRRGHRLKINVVIKVPERFNVDFSSGAGNVEIVEVDGRIEGRTGAGNITLSGVRGIVDVSSGAGNIEMDGDIERAEVHTGAGNIDLYGLTGAVEASTGAGNVYAEITRQPEDDSNLGSGAGNVTVSLADDIGVYVDATAALGSADCDFPLKVEGKWLKKSFSGKINGGGPELRMHAGVGNVSLRRD